MGRHARAQHAAAALVAVDVLRLHRLGGRLLGRLSGLAADQQFHAGRVRLAFAQRGRIRPRRARRPRAARWSANWRPLRSPQIVADPQLLDFARAQGRVAFADNCAPCHGAGGGGAKGYPNLNDDDWLWGGKLAEIEQTIRHGARSGDEKGHQGNMPAFGRDNILKAERDLGGRRLRALALRPAGGAGRRSRARQEGLRRQLRRLPRRRKARAIAKLGAPNLTDKIWLYGSDKATIMQGVINGRGGVMPAWEGRLERTDHQGADRLRLDLRRRREITVSAATTTLEQPVPDAPSSCRSWWRTPKSAARRPTTTSRSTRRAGRSIRRARTAPSAASNGRCCSSRSASIICCRSCAGIAAPTRRRRRC